MPTNLRLPTVRPSILDASGLIVAPARTALSEHASGPLSTGTATLLVLLSVGAAEHDGPGGA